MKKLFAALVIVCFFSCKKEHSADTNYHVSFAVNGVTKNYTGHVLAHADTTSGYVEFTILGTNTMTSTDDYLGIYLNNDPGGSNIASGQYQDAATSYTLLTTYQNSGREYEAGQTVAQDAATDNITIANHFKVIITSMDKNTTRGTFSGDYYENGDVQGTKISITNGEFYAPIQ